MKLSIAWIFDHIDADWKKLDVPALVKKINSTTSEIEGFSHIAVDLKLFTFGKVVSFDVDKVTLFSPELKKEIIVPGRDNVQEGQTFLLIKKESSWEWASALDLHGSKEGPLPALYCSDDELAGGWKKSFEAEDYILELDNKAITNRPDLWGHRGFAREIAAILNVPLLPVDQLIDQCGVIEHATSAPATGTLPITITNKAPKVCRRFAGMYIDNIEHRPSVLWMAHRLMRVDARPIDLLVDLTNYVLFDLSQPMHVFDVDKLTEKQIVPRMAKKGETLELLDGQTIELSPDDLVITDGRIPVALAGVMGGMLTAETDATSRIFIESANFDPASVRLSAARHKIRTEASARFEKDLDRAQNVTAIQRFVKLLVREGVAIKGMSEIASIGEPVYEQVITIDHSLIEERVGVKLSSQEVTHILEIIGFGVTQSQEAPVIYSLTVPTFRASGVSIQADIIEEIARFYGYDNIPLKLPVHQMSAYDLTPILRVRQIKNYMAFGLHMNEIQHYALLDEPFCRQIGWEPTNPVDLLNPISSDKTRLATTLMPDMFKAIEHNSSSCDQLRFFQWGRTWHLHSKLPKDVLGRIVGLKGPFVLERRQLAGVIFDSKNEVDFYQLKADINSLFASFGMNVEWTKNLSPDQPWYHEHQTANLIHDGQCIGTIGKVAPAFLHSIAQGDALAFEIDGDYLLAFRAKTVSYQALSKYPPVVLDISMMVPLELTVQAAAQAISSVDLRIQEPELIDMFTKKEWADKKSFTFRFVIKDATKTLSKDEIDQVWDAVVTAVKKVGAQVR